MPLLKYPPGSDIYNIARTSMITSLFCILVLLAHGRGQLVVLRHVDQPKLAVLRGLADYKII